MELSPEMPVSATFPSGPANHDTGWGRDETEGTRTPRSRTSKQHLGDERRYDNSASADPWQSGGPGQVRGFRLQRTSNPDLFSWLYRNEVCRRALPLCDNRTEFRDMLQPRHTRPWQLPILPINLHFLHPSNRSRNPPPWVDRIHSQGHHLQGHTPLTHLHHPPHDLSLPHQVVALSQVGRNREIHEPTIPGTYPFMSSLL